MNTDRFKGYGEDVRTLVLDFEKMYRQGSNRYYDVDQLETILDFYLDTYDEEMIEKAVGCRIAYVSVGADRDACILR